MAVSASEPSRRLREIRAQRRLREIEGRLRKIHSQHPKQLLPEVKRQEWNKLNAKHAEITTRIFGGNAAHPFLPVTTNKVWPEYDVEHVTTAALYDPEKHGEERMLPFVFVMTRLPEDPPTAYLRIFIPFGVDQSHPDAACELQRLIEDSVADYRKREQPDPDAK